jgi:predicted site-specific integrase-resolvase
MRIYVNSKEACKRLEISDTMLKRLADAGKIDYLIRPGEIYYDIEEFLVDKDLKNKIVEEQQSIQKD